ncbi:MAG: hypothetical protein AAB515_00795 [Patescibacteria group bacterium]
MPQDINAENLPSLDIKAIALNRDRLGTLAFESVEPILEELKKLYTELDNLDYKTRLTLDEVNQIDTAKNQLVQYLTQLEQFDIQQAGAKDVHDRIENEIKQHHNSIIKSFRNYLVYLRQELALKSKSAEELQKERQDALQAKKQYDELTTQLKQQLEELGSQKQLIETGKGEVATKQLAHHFAKQANDYTESATRWLKFRNYFYWAFFIIVGANVYVYLFSDRGIFTLQYGLVKLALLSAIGYAIAFSAKNYNIQSNLEAISRHRKNVAQTIEDFLGTNPAPEVRDAMLKHATEALFRHFPTGYITKSESRDGGPLYEIVNNLIKPGSST